MKALQLLSTNKPLRLVNVDEPTPKGAQVVVRIQAAAINHRDLWIQKGQYAGIQLPITLGSDGAGYYGRKKIIINPSLNWASQSAFPPTSFKILGLPDPGCFAEKVLVPKRNVYPMPKHLNFAQAAGLPLAGLTAYRVLFTRCRLKKRDKVLISGIGGGVALMAFQFAVANGNEVWVTSSSRAKIQKAILQGAAGGVLYSNEKWDKQIVAAANGTFDVIIDSAAGDGFGTLVKVASFGARIGLYGGTQGKISGVIPQIIFWKQLSVVGSTMGSGAEFSKMLAFVNRHKIVPIIDTIYPINKANTAFRRMDSGKQFGKLVLEIASITV